MVTLHSFVAKDALLEIVDQQNEQKTVFRSDAFSQTHRRMGE